jgi:hypothetical protein
VQFAVPSFTTYAIVQVNQRVSAKSLTKQLKRLTLCQPFFMSMEGRYVATVGNVVATMSMEGRYVATVGVITVFRNANSLAFRRYHAFASGEGRMIVATM